MMKLCFYLLMLAMLPLQLLSKPMEPMENDILIYGHGTTQVDSEIDEADSLIANKPIRGSVLVTHDVNSSIDENSFRMGNKPLKVELVQSANMSNYSKLVVTIYAFQIEGMKEGIHLLPPIKVKVDGKEYQADPLRIQVGSG